MKDEAYYIGCDVGTGSVRAGIFDRNGKMKSEDNHPITLWRPDTDFVEQSSEDIWQACCKSIMGAMEQARLTPEQIQGLGFDATCSLVVIGENDRPLAVGPDNKDKQNMIVWMDHRAIEEARHINETHHEVLDYVGGTISPEMQTPKLLWLKKHKPETWAKATKFFDLADYLVYRATGADVRSTCTTTCKWTYQSHKDDAGRGTAGWDDSFFAEVGLGELADEGYKRIGQKIRPVGESVGRGLTQAAAGDMGLRPHTPVGVAMIDAHAGGIGLLGMDSDAGKEGNNLENRIALIGGTSSCHMAVSREAQFIDGVWGPYYAAMLPGMWLTEGGQSATGVLIDHVIFSSHLSAELKQQAKADQTSVYQLLNTRLAQLAARKELSDVGMLTQDLHVLPYFHGNRSPRANPSLTGSICGLRLSSTLDDLTLLYLAVIQSIAYGTRHIIETLNEEGYAINTIMATGGGTKNKLFLQQHADICNCRIVLPAESEAVLLGSAILGAVASGTYATIYKAMEKMNTAGETVHPLGGSTQQFHQRKYRVFQKMYRDERAYMDLMQDKEATKSVKQH